MLVRTAPDLRPDRFPDRFPERFDATIAANTLARGDASAALRTQYDRDEEIFVEGDEADRIYRVVSGAVRVCKVLSDGRRQIAGFYLAGEVFGLEASAAHRFSAEAVVDTRLDVLSRAAVYGRAARDPDYARSLWAMTGAHLDRAQEHMLLLGRKTAVERVAAFLLDMAERSGLAQVVELPMGRQDIADFLGLTMETVSRTLTQLERQGAITMPSARRVALTDPAELRSIGD